jgi:hypothetical protein
MVAGSKDKSIQDILEIFDKLPVYPDQLYHWTEAIQSTSQNMCEDKTKIKFRYELEDKAMKFYLKDSKARDCLVKSIEIHLTSVPEVLQGFFSVLKYNLKNVKFES